ncbi:LysR family transcriptional regulator [Vibrio sp. HN007]|uniref:LysR family transcriptional regulator n=1 Tax=Vibrio iocasae TaxID=3098914 RepID=UPI0035D484CB
MDMATRLDIFLDVVTHGSFSKAAESRNLDRSVISKQLKILEGELGVRLLNRSIRALSATDAGTRIVSQAKSIRNTLTDTVLIAKSYHEKPQGVLRVTSPTLFGNMYVQKAIHSFMDKYPDINIKLELSDKKTDIIGDRFDIAFRIGPSRDSNLIAKKLADNKVALLASEEFVQKHGMPKTPEELVKLPGIIYTNGVYKTDKLAISESPESNAMHTHHIEGRLEVNDVSACNEAVYSGLGYASIPLFTLDRTIKERALVPLLTEYTLPANEWGIYAVYPHRNQTPIVKLFIEAVQDIIGTPPKWESYIDNYKTMYKRVAI